MNSEEIDTIRALGFRDGRLYFRNRLGLFRVQGWPRLIAEKRSKGNLWSPLESRSREQLFQDNTFDVRVDPAGMLSGAGEEQLHYDEDQSLMPWAQSLWQLEAAISKRHWRRFLQTIPERVRRAASRLKCDFFSALELMIEAPDAMDLAERGPVLATALARHWEFPAVGCIDWAKVREKVRGRRRHIVAWLGYPESEVLVRGLERVLVGSIDAAHSIRAGLLAIADPFSRTVLAHVPEISAWELGFASDPWTRSWLDPKLSEKMGHGLSEAIHRLFYPINRLLDAGLIELPDAERLSRLSPRRASPRTFLPYLKSDALAGGPSPVAAGVYRLDSLHALLAEGEEMGHCVGSMPYFLRAVIDGYAIYSVSWPVRATLALSRRDEQSWDVDELTGKCNAEVGLSDAQQIAAAFAITIDLRDWILSRSRPDRRLVEIAEI
jgi:hypothetical protein